MIHLPTKQHHQAPARLSVAGALRQIERAFLGADGDEYNATYYPHQEVTDLLRAYSIHKTALAPGDQPKCNYCESRIEHAATLQVEHYRPKAKVEAGENDNVETSGYFWLGLEWTNLLLACPKCNGKDAKGNKFPIAGIRAVPHNPVQRAGRVLSLVRTDCLTNCLVLQQELPILLNPEVDHPENCLTFNILGHIRGIGNDAYRADKSAEIYRLNRDELQINRKKVWDAIKNDINVDIGGHQANFLTEDGLRFRFRALAAKLIKRKEASEEYTLWGRFLNTEIALMLTYLDAFYRNLFIEEYNDVLANQP
ncbi:HNH endonuclease [Pedobacter miscanthi]|uniref:TIGR02646 family protein n=1 Tax=Pedobacter miscanthi TaxID=2259170 RepID=A0A366KYN6_9SPHI|nr:hypothetical protein [Pedobacter miscanthi]RBQ06698.1 hypothetical protein DRW42_13005 [Pedobacter miscanthi]